LARKLSTFPPEGVSHLPISIAIFSLILRTNTNQTTDFCLDVGFVEFEGLQESFHAFALDVIECEGMRGEIAKSS
jgi:hypothetical protein